MVIAYSPPIFSNNITKYPNGTAYDSALTYGFQVNATDLDGNMDKSWLEINNTGTLANISALNDTADIFYVNLTQSQFKSAGVYSYRWILNDTDNAVNATEWVYYYIDKALPTCAIFPVTQSRMYESATVEYCTGTNPEVDCSMYRDDVNLTVPCNYSSPVLDSGIHPYVSNTTETENYTACVDATSTLTVVPIDVLVWSYPQNQTTTYGNSLQMYCLSNYTGIYPRKCNLFLNGTNVTALNDTAITLNASGWMFKANFSKLSANYVWADNSSFVNMNKGASFVKLGNAAFANTSYPNPLTAFCADNSTDAGNHCNLFRNITGTELVNVTDTENGTVMYLGAGAYIYKANISASENFTAYTNTSVIIVQPRYFTFTLRPITSTETHGTEIWHNITSNSTIAISKLTMWRDGVNVTALNGTKETLAAGTHEFWANSTLDSQNNSYSNLTETVTVNQGELNIALFLNGTTGSRVYKNGTAINLTAVANSTLAPVNITANITGWTLQNGTGRTENVTVWNFTSSGMYNITAFTNGNGNFTSNRTTWWLTADAQNPLVVLFDLNDTYIHFNQSIMLRVNATDDINVSNVTATIQASSSTFNVTLQKDALGNYTYNLTKAELGGFSANATLINITKIYANDTADWQVVNASTLQFDYGRTFEINSSVMWGDSPDPATNSVGSAVTFWVKYNTTEGITLPGSTCTVDVFSGTYAMYYSAARARWEVTVSTEGRTIDTYTYFLNCTNTSYQSQNCLNSNQTVIVTEGSAGHAPGGGGGGGGELPTVNFTLEPELLVFSAGRGQTGLVAAIGKDYSFRVCSQEESELRIYPSVFGDYGRWANIYSARPNDAVVWTTPITIGWITVEPLNCTDIVLTVNVPADAPSGEYDIGFKVQALGTSTEKSAIMKVSTSLGTITELLKAAFRKMAWGVDIKEDCAGATGNLCIVGRNPVSVPYVGASLSTLAIISAFSLLRKMKPLKDGKAIPFGLSLLVSIIVLGFIPA